MDHRLDIAGAARFFLDSCGDPEPPVDPVDLARLWGLAVAEGTGPAQTVGGAIFFDPSREPWQQRFDIAHELSTRRPAEGLPGRISDRERHPGPRA